MTLNQLLSETYALGFEEATELSEDFIFSANRAIRFINNEHADEKTGIVFVPKHNTVFHLSSYEYTPGNDIVIKLPPAVAYSFRVYGKGSCSIKDSSGTKSRSFSCGTVNIRGFISGEEATLTFFSDTAFTILDLYAFSSVRSESENDIPIIKDTSEYTITDFISNFLYATRSPYDKNGNPIEGAKILGNILTLPSSFFGEVFISYKGLPKALSIDERDADIDVPKRCEHLCPILTAAYIWLDDDAEKASYYMQIYHEESGRMSFTVPKNINSHYSDVTGWAK